MTASDYSAVEPAEIRRLLSKARASWLAACGSDDPPERHYYADLCRDMEICPVCWGSNDPRHSCNAGPPKVTKPRKRATS